MRYLFALDLKSLLVLSGVSFFGLTLYSDEIIAYLVEVDVINSEVLESGKQNLILKKESKLKDLERVFTENQIDLCKFISTFFEIYRNKSR